MSHTYGLGGDYGGSAPARSSGPTWAEFESLQRRVLALEKLLREQGASVPEDRPPAYLSTPRNAPTK